MQATIRATSQTTKMEAMARLAKEVLLQRLDEAVAGLVDEAGPRAAPLRLSVNHRLLAI